MPRIPITKMYIGALLLSFFSFSSSAPLSNINSGNDDMVDNLLALFARQLPECMNPGRYRTKQEIILSCVATIFACTWVAIHPNVPGIWDSWWEKTKRKLIMMIYAVLAPEFIAFWALRQWIAAGRIAKRFNNEFNTKCEAQGFWATVQNCMVECFKGPVQILPTNWTRTHGFFVQMGGFMLYEGRKPVRVLKFDELVRMTAKGEVEMPDITEDEVNNMSKGDLLSKLVVVLQTTWFAFQCLARWATHLPVTELEVVTLAFAALNVVTYLLWWKKPQNVLVAVRIQRKRGPETDSGGSMIEGDVETEGFLRGSEEKDSWLGKRLSVVMNERWDGMNQWGRRRWFKGWLFGVPFTLIAGLVRPLMKMSGDNVIVGMPGDHTKLKLRVPMFEADNPNQDRDVIPISAIGILFGAIHIIPWSSPFPSTAELWLWRSSALVITIEPLTLSLLILVFNLSDHYRNIFSTSLIWIALSVSVLGAPLYIFARLILLVIAFTTLRSLPQGVYLEIEWTTFVPHL